jgi:hypothetical protein
MYYLNYTIIQFFNVINNNNNNKATLLYSAIIHSCALKVDNWIAEALVRAQPYPDKYLLNKYVFNCFLKVQIEFEILLVSESKAIFLKFMGKELKVVGPATE